MSIYNQSRRPEDNLWALFKEVCKAEGMKVPDILQFGPLSMTKFRESEDPTVNVFLPQEIVKEPMMAEVAGPDGTKVMKAVVDEAGNPRYDFSKSVPRRVADGQMRTIHREGPPREVVIAPTIAVSIMYNITWEDGSGDPFNAAVSWNTKATSVKRVPSEVMEEMVQDPLILCTCDDPVSMFSLDDPSSRAMAMRLFFHPNCASSPYWWPQARKEAVGIHIDYAGPGHVPPYHQFRCMTMEVRRDRTAEPPRRSAKALDFINATRREPADVMLRLAAECGVTPNPGPNAADDAYTLLCQKAITQDGAQEVLNAALKDVGRSSLESRLETRGLAMQEADGRWVWCMTASDPVPIPNCRPVKGGLQEMLNTDAATAVEAMLLVKAHQAANARLGASDDPLAGLDHRVRMCVERGKEWAASGAAGPLPEGHIYLSGGKGNGMWVGYNRTQIIGVKNAVEPEAQVAILLAHVRKKAAGDMDKGIEFLAQVTTDQRKVSGA